MRQLYLLGGIAVLGLASLVGWVTSGKAEPAKIRNSGSLQIIERVPAQPDNDPEITIPDPVSPARYRPAPVPPPLVNSSDEPTGTRAAPPKVKEPAQLPPEPMQIPEDLTTPAADSKPEKSSNENGSAEKILRGEVSTSSTQPSIHMEWLGPSGVKLGASAVYTLVVRNMAAIPVQKVVVQAKIASGLNVLGTEPKVEATGGVIMWDIGNLLAKQERRLTVRVASTQKGDVACQAWVTFTGSSLMKVHVREAKLAVKFHTPATVLVGEPANIVIGVTNTGDYAAEHATVRATLSDGLETIRGNRLQFELGTLGAGETRTVTIPCMTRMAGQQKCQAVAEADEGLKASESLAIAVVQPRIELAVSGPKLRYLDKKAVYHLKVTNPCEAPASNVFVTEVVPTGFRFIQADNGGQLDDVTGAVKWFIGELQPGQSKEVQLELVAAQTGEFTHHMMANASRGMKAEQELKTTVEGLSALAMELIDSDDPVEIGGETTYEVRVTNIGTNAESDLRLACSLPAQLKLKSIHGPSKYEIKGRDVVFQALPRLSPRADVVFKITMTAQARGDARFKATLTSSSLVEPIVKVEPTKVYGD